jgi:hypothetical protein
MRASTFRKINASFATLAVIAFLGTSPVQARVGVAAISAAGGRSWGEDLAGVVFTQADLVGAVFIRGRECTAAHTAITASLAVTTPVW